MKETKQQYKKYENTSILYAKNSIITSKYNEQKVFHKKTVLKNFATSTGKHLCQNLFFNKNAGLQGPSFIKKRLVKFLRTPILKNICERLLLKVTLELFSMRTNNIRSEEDVFTKIKQNKNRSKTQLYGKICLFMMFFIISFFSFSPLHFRRHLSYIIKDDTSESFETA